MENKYFTPDIEDFHIGYEFQRFIPRSNATEEECWETIKLSVNYLTLDEIDDEIIEKEIRVPYLTKEQIEAEGWKHYGNNCFDLNSRWFCSWYPEQKRLEVYDNENENQFAGECKDINTFRKICKLLEI